VSTTPTAKRKRLKARCFRCGRVLYEDSYVYSQYTKRHYCARLAGCKQR